jgi:outer membrane protein assembly factor BamB
MSEIEQRHTRIEKTIDTVVGKVVLENPAFYPGDESNLYCVAADGKIIWFAERPEAGSHYSRVRFDDQGEKLLTYSTRGHACEVDLQTGKLLGQVSML